MSSAVYNTKSAANSQFLTTATKMLKYQHIAPAPMSASELKTRKYTPRAINGPYSVDQTHSVQRRNARERNRVKQVNTSFARLRQHIPQTIITELTKGGGRGPHKKVSKVDTLRIAVEYIRRLQDLVDDLNASSSNTTMPDTTSNSSYTSSSTADSPMIPASAQLYYTHVPSPLQQKLQQHQQQQQLLQYPINLLTPVSMQSYSPPPQTFGDTGCLSPTSSFNSSMSFDSGTFEPTPQQLSPQNVITSDNNLNKQHLDLQLKFEPYDSLNLHEEDCTPDDEEILDYISMWQEQ